MTIEVGNYAGKMKGDEDLKQVLGLVLSLIQSVRVLLLDSPWICLLASAFTQFSSWPMACGNIKQVKRTLFYALRMQIRIKRQKT